MVGMQNHVSTFYLFIYLFVFIFIFFFYPGFLLQPFTNHRTARKWGGHFFDSSLPLPLALQTLSHQPGNYCRELTSAHRQQPISERKLLITKLSALGTFYLFTLADSQSHIHHNNSGVCFSPFYQPFVLHSTFKMLLTFEVVQLLTSV